MSKATWRPDDAAWLAAHPGEGLPPETPYSNTRGPGIFGQPFGAGPGVSHKPSVIAPPDTPSLEEVAWVMNRGFLPLRYFRAEKIARAEKRAELVDEGRQIAQREGMQEATLMALANIIRIGTGR